MDPGLYTLLLLLLLGSPEGMARGPHPPSQIGGWDTAERGSLGQGLLRCGGEAENAPLGSARVVGLTRQGAARPPCSLGA